MEGIAGSVVRPSEPGYDDQRLGLNQALEPRPAYIVGATGEHDMVAAVRLAAREKRAVAVRATGHGPAASADDAVLVDTRRMDGVRVDAEKKTAWIEAGAQWRHVVALATPHGLAPLSGSNPGVGAIGYLVGGGAGLLGRRFGFGADHVRRLRVVTADGALREASPDSDAELFWAVRGGKDNFGLVVGAEVDLFDVPRLYGGELCFTGAATADALHAYAEWTRAAPEEMASSVLLMRYPDDPAIPEPLRGQFVTHVRVAYSGEAADGERLTRPLREFGPVLLDTVRDMPYAEVDTVHHEPTGEPFVAYDRNVLLKELTAEAVDTLVTLAGPRAEVPLVVELRHFGGAYARPPKVPNCVGGRDAAFSLFAAADADQRNRQLRDELLRELRRWSTGGMNLNFTGVEDASPDVVRTAYTAADYDRLTELKARFDPDNMFRANLNIPPKS
ncbi:FAD-binding oxidoreductase [Phytohabitans aurantiacus]|uniref:Oxidoreductase n=1 Tax=Phytohabitans aurantiacus TaxID=3016789 RepID=A0ABQ5R6W9_9ACTN|nr:FAD-binding oxidoreductase [Phytohabitans aurantiacus]GLI02158.1 oxidoreductase [Phytohabitans aurantiacus]